MQWKNKYVLQDYMFAWKRERKKRRKSVEETRNNYAMETGKCVTQDRFEWKKQREKLRKEMSVNWKGSTR
jgi:hypothetical protein